MKKKKTKKNVKNKKANISLDHKEIKSVAKINNILLGELIRFDLDSNRVQKDDFANIHSRIDEIVEFITKIRASYMMNALLERIVQPKKAGKTSEQN